MPCQKLLHKCFVENTNNLIIQLFRYTFAGGAAFVIDFALLWLLTEYVGLHYLVSASLSFIAGLLVNYFISKAWVFSKARLADKRVEFFFFALIGIGGLFINNALLWVITDFANVYYLWSKIITAVLVYLYNFLARKYLLF